MVRPKLPKGQARGASLVIRLRHDERKRVVAAAKQAGTTLSAWIRERLLGP